MKIYVESIFDCSPEKVWKEVQKSSLLLEVMKPLARIEPVETAFPETWQEGKTVLCSCFMFGILPMGVRKLFFESIDKKKKEIQTRESDPMIRKWDHLIKVEATPDGKTRYSDRIELDAGLLTPLFGLYVRYFYGHRQRRWQNRVIPRLNG